MKSTGVLVKLSGPLDSHRAALPRQRPPGTRSSYCSRWQPSRRSAAMPRRRRRSTHGCWSSRAPTAWRRRLPSSIPGTRLTQSGGNWARVRWPPSRIWNRLGCPRGRAAKTRRPWRGAPRMPARPTGERGSLCARPAPELAPRRRLHAAARRPEAAGRERDQNRASGYRLRPEHKACPQFIVTGEEKNR